MYCAINAVMNPSKFSIASVAVLQHSSMSLRYSIQLILYETKSFRQHISKLKNLYGIEDVKMKLKEGEVSYPSPNSKDTGMSFELRYVPVFSPL
jgi:hypothetical protein